MSGTGKPAVPFHTSPGIRSRPLFYAKDIPHLEGCSGLKLLPSANSHAIAAALCETYDVAAFIEDDVRRPPLSELEAYFARVRDACRQLLDLLGLEGNHTLLTAERSTLPPDLTHSDGLEWLGRFATSLSRYWQPDLEAILAAGQYEAAEAGKAIGAEREAYYRALADAPRTLALLAAGAEYSRCTAVRVRQAESQNWPRGPREKAGLDSLFRGLAGVFFGTFGVPPAVGSDRADPAQASLLWVEAVLAYAAEQASDAVRPGAVRAEAHSLVRVARAAHQFKRATKAKRLAEGWHAWRALSDEDRWSNVAWFWDYRTWDGNPVPQWVRDRPIAGPKQAGIGTQVNAGSDRRGARSRKGQDGTG